MILVTIAQTKRVTPDWDLELSYDAQRCKEALQKRWPNHTFVIDHRALCHYAIEIDAAKFHLGERCTQEMKGFAEGFMASTFLWER